MSDIKTLKNVLSKMLDTIITHATYESQLFQCGSVGDVRLLTGIAETSCGKEIPYNVVLKIQRKWERPGDPESWRREYDLYASELGSFFTDSLRWPACYHYEKSENETRLWLEYIDGTSGADLTSEMFECASEELGRFQGKLYTEQPLKMPGNLTTPDSMKNYHHYNRSKAEQYKYIRQADCTIPPHLCKMIIDMDEKSDSVWAEIR